MAATDRVLTIAALGRPFHLGSLYDIRSDQIIAGVTLWNKEVLEGQIHEQNTWHSAYEVITSDSIHDKTSALEISGSLNLSILGGLVEAKGSAKYLESKKKSSHQERVTLQYKCSTKATELTMDHLGPGNIMHPDVINKGIATHVVTGIEYGAHAFFIFDRTYAVSESDKKISGNLCGEISKIPKMIANMKGKFQYESADQDLSANETIKCTFFGDFYLRNNPSTYEEAIHIYKELPSILGENGENAVPIRVTLFPLDKLGTRANQIVREISNYLVSDTEEILETICEMQTMCSDLLNYEATKNFPRIKQEVLDFESLIRAFKRGLQRQLCEILPAIRGGGQEETSLAALLQRTELSPFSTSSLRAWTSRQEEQVKIFSGYIKYLTGTTLACGASDLNSVIMNPETELVICLIILVPRLTGQLENMRKYLKVMETDEEILEAKVPGSLVCSRKVNIRSFKDFVTANKGDTKFVVMEEGCDSEELSTVVRYYKDGQCMSESYELPSAPESVEANDDDFCTEQVTVRWSTPRQGNANIQRYRVMYWKVESEESPRIEWCKTNLTILTKLTPNTKYQVRVQAWCEVGFSPQLDITVQTKPITLVSHDAVDGAVQALDGGEQLTIKLLQEAVINANASGSKLWTCLTKQGRPRYAQVSLWENRLHLHALCNGRPPLHHQIIPYKSVLDLVAEGACVVFLEIWWGGRVRGRVYIELLDHEGRTRQFKALCTGECGPSYTGARFLEVERNYTTNKVWCGDYENNDGSGGAALPGMERGRKNNQPIRAGLVAGYYFQGHKPSHFTIYTKDLPRQFYENTPIGRVVRGLDIISSVADLMDVRQAYVSDCGLLL